MREEKARLEGFLYFDCQTRCIRLIPLLKQAGERGLASLSHMAEFHYQVLESESDIDGIRDFYLVWYKPNSSCESGWQYEGCSNYTVFECADAVKGGTSSLDSAKVCEINDLVNSLKQGLNQDIVLTVAFDTMLNKRIIVDGNKRIVALMLIYLENQSKFPALLNSQYSIKVLELRSEVAHVLYPCDFLSFIKKRQGNLGVSS